MNKEKLYPWIPIVGVFLVAIHSGKDMGLRNTFVFWGSVAVQVVSILATALALHYLP